MAFLYRRLAVTERSLFHVRLHVWPLLLLRSAGWGLLAGAAVSVAAAFIGTTLTPDAVLWLWGTAAVLALIRVRYLCFAYSAGVLGVLQAVCGLLSLEESGGTAGRLGASLAALDMPGLLLLVALLHAAEALLVRKDGGSLASPLYLEGKRGKLIGGYSLQGLWPVPLLLLVPVSGGAEGAAAALPWTPLLGGEAWSAGWTVLALPAIIGFSDLALSELPKHVARLASRRLLLYSLVLVVLALAAAFARPLVVVASLAALGLHEALTQLAERVQRQRPPRFVNDARGLCILGVLPGTPAEEMGLEAGEVLHKVNGLRVRTKEDLHAALHENSAFCRLEVLNLDGQLKFAQRARFAGEHHQLGVVLAPDEDAAYSAVPARGSVLALLLRARRARRRAAGDSASM
ncbi:PDZ domain-containing protein [Paenibacillus albicereus]|uniref:PDZ domain-containing protein n=2 Tax=Paenibacillus albicereus TaxID=2726185 RepID=A0A6H2H5B1_9BACL|nr:PDZ domain-containing protein [Paenibacillus albicereus]